MSGGETDSAEFGTETKAKYADKTSRSSSSSVPLSPRSREYLRLRVNARERQRMHDMNSALDALRMAMPYAQGPAVKKLSKMNTLLLARNYILLLTRTLDDLRRLLVETHGRQRLPWSPRLDAAMGNHQIYAQQQQYAEELIRREQELMRFQLELERPSRTEPPLMELQDDDDDEGPRQPAAKKHRRSTSVVPGRATLALHPEERKISRPVASAFYSTNERLSYASLPSLIHQKVMPHSRPIVAPTLQLPTVAQPPLGLQAPITVAMTSALAEGHVMTSSIATSSAITSSSLHHIGAFGATIPCPCPQCYNDKPTYVFPIDFTLASKIL